MGAFLPAEPVRVQPRISGSVSRCLRPVRKGSAGGCWLAAVLPIQAISPTIWCMARKRRRCLSWCACAIDAGPLKRVSLRPRERSAWTTMRCGPGRRGTASSRSVCWPIRRWSSCGSAPCRRGPCTSGQRAKGGLGAPASRSRSPKSAGGAGAARARREQSFRLEWSDGGALTKPWPPAVTPHGGCKERWRPTGRSSFP